MGLTKKTSWSDLWKKEDWLACWIGFIIIAIGCVAVLTGWFDFSALKFSTWSLGERAATKAVPLGEQLGQWVFWRKLLVTFVTLCVLFAIGVKLLCLALSAMGLGSMWMAIFADVGVMVLAVLNAIRALFVKRL